MRRIKPEQGAESRAGCARRAVHFLKLAREEAQLAGAPQLLKRIRAALDSADGAVRHAEGRVVRG